MQVKYQSRAAAIAAIATLLSACAGVPSFRGVETVSLSNRAFSIAPPRVSLNGDSSLAPGRAAGQGFAATEACGPFALFCAIVTVPIGAIVGATAKVTQKLPQVQVIELSRVTAEIAAPIDFTVGFDTALREEAQRRGLRVDAGRHDAQVRIQSAELSWDISVGNHVAMRMDIGIELISDGKRSSRRVTYKSDAAQVADWIADDGERLRQELEAVAAAASRDVWKEILGQVEADASPAARSTRPTMI
jgi:hypothetical protein